MKKNNLFKTACTILGVVLFVAMAAALIFPELGIAELVGIGISGPAVFASTAVVGTPTYQNTNDAESGHQVRDISTVVTEIKPDEYPLDTMLRNVRKAEKADNVKVDYETVKYRERGDALTAKFTAADDANDNSVDLTVANVKIWGVDDTIYVPEVVTGTVGGKALRLHVSAVNRSTNKITVSALNATTETRVPTIEDATKLYRMGTAKDELASTTDVITQVPGQDYNFCQIQMCYLEQSVLNDLVKSYSGYSHRDKMLQEVYNMRSSCEATHLFGVRKQFVDPVDGKTKYHAGGIESFLTQSIEFGTGSSSVDPELDDILKLLETTFAGNAGSSQRLLLAGKKAITGIQGITFEKQQMAKEVGMFHGVRVTKLESDFGTLNIKHSKMLDQMGWDSQAMVIDLQHIYKHDLEPMHKSNLDPDKAGQRRVKDAVRILENSCITPRYIDSSESVHFIWKPKAS